MDWPEVWVHDPVSRAGEPRSEVLSITLSYRAIELIRGGPVAPPTGETIAANREWLENALRGRIKLVEGPTMPAHVAAAASLSGLPWIILYFKPPKSLKTQGQRKFVGEAFKDITQVPFEVVKGVPDPARLLYVWVKVFGGMSVKFDILRITLITPQLGLEELFGPHSPQELANIIADYVQVPGDRVGDDEAIAPRADTELIRLYFLMRDAETYIGQIPEMGWPSHPAAPVKMPHGRTHYAKEPSELRKDLQTSMPQ